MVYFLGRKLVIGIARMLMIALGCAGIAPAMTIVLHPDAGLSGNAAALGAFQRAANTWGSQFSDNITININVGLGTLATPNSISQTSATLLSGSYSIVRTAMIADAADEPSNAIVANLPTAGQFSGAVPNGFFFSNGILLSRANALALGFANLPGTNDGTITFNSSFAFDFDNSNGVGVGLVDFETMAAHEIGHILGFVSAVDDIDFLISQGTPGVIAMYTMDLFRFSPGNVPTNAAQFTTNSRSLLPGASAFFSDSINSWALSTGAFNGDGHQAGTWRDDVLSGTLIGIMDPTPTASITGRPSGADLRVFDLLGYDLAATAEVPEPGTYIMIGLGLTAIVALRRCRA